MLSHAWQLLALLFSLKALQPACVIQHVVRKKVQPICVARCDFETVVVCSSDADSLRTFQRYIERGDVWC